MIRRLPVLLITLLILSSLSTATTYFYAGEHKLATKNNMETSYTYNDRLGTDIETKNLPFGQIIVKGDLLGFTGKEQDESKLHYFGARYYDSNTGRFSTIDPIEESYPYSYVHNNPLNKIDPTGMATRDGLAYMNQRNTEQTPSQNELFFNENIHYDGIGTDEIYNGPFEPMIGQPNPWSESANTDAGLLDPLNYIDVGAGVGFFKLVKGGANALFRAGSRESTEMFFKSATSRTVPWRFDKGWTDITDEYNWLKAMSAESDYFVKPLSLVTDDAGKVIGYNMERIQGKMISEIIEETGTLPETINTQIREATKAMHSRGFAHGDFHTQNMMLTPEGKLKIIDPVGYPQNYEYLEQAIVEDWIRTSGAHMNELVEAGMMN